MCAKSNPTTPDEYDSLFDSLDPEGVRQLKYHQHKGISLRAAWLEFVRAEIKPKRSETVESFESFRVRRLLGFLEGRLGVSIPRFWERALLSAHRGVNPDEEPLDRVYASFPRGDHLFYKKTESGVSAPSGVSLKERPGDWLLTVGNRSISIPVPLMKEATERLADDDDDGIMPFRDGSGVTALLSADDCYLAFHSVGHGPYKLVHLDPQTIQVRWKVDVEAYAEGAFFGADTYDFTGWSYHWVTLVEKNGVLFVFGVSAECAYIEAFRTQDGTNLFRFSTGY